MKKYIKTRNKIYEVTNDKWGRNSVIEEDGVFKLHSENMGHHWYSKLDVIDQADNPEKLCDKFVLKDCDIIFLNKEHTQYHFEGENEWFDITDVELRKGICGAIWTDGSLKYVIQMNDKKEFVLIYE